jgi:ABC-type sugar transport system substrate-binding protein
VLLGLLVVLVAGCGGDDDDSGGDRGERFAAIIKGLDNPFFVTMRDGLVGAARERQVDLRVETAGDIQDPSGQAFALESLIEDGAGCFVLNPINPTNLVEPLAELPEGTPIVNVDSLVDARAARALGAEIATYIGTDNVAAGRIGADAMATLVPPGASVAVVTGVPGDPGSGMRARGFRGAAGGRFRIAQSVAADFDREQARLATATLLRANPDLEGIFAVNDEMALGIADALVTAGRRGEIAVIGMDGTSEALAAIRRGDMSATVSQYPYAMGELAIQACLAALDGETVPRRIDAPVQVVTRGNVDRAVESFPAPVEPFDNPLTKRREGPSS